MSEPAEEHQPTVVDLFCGAGGLSEGFRLAGWTPIVGSDIDPDARLISLADWLAGLDQPSG